MNAVQCLVAATIVLTLSGAASGQGYFATRIAAGGEDYTVATALNDVDPPQVAGHVLISPTNIQAFRWQNGSATLLGGLFNPDGTFSWSSSISNSGSVAGFSLWVGGSFQVPHAIISDGVSMTDLGTFFDPNYPAWESEARGVSDSGVVVGWAGGHPKSNHAACYWVDEEIFPLWSLSDQADIYGTATAVKDVGPSWIAVGQTITKVSEGVYEDQAVRWSPGPTGLGTLKQSGLGTSMALALNAHKTIVGWSDTDRVIRCAFIRRDGQPMLDLMPWNETFSSDAAAINDCEIVVGTWAGYAYVWAPVGNSGAGAVALLSDLVQNMVFDVGKGVGVNNENYILVSETESPSGGGSFLLEPNGLSLLGPTPGEVLQNNYLAVINADPGSSVWLVARPQSGSTPVPGCPGVSVGMGNVRYGVQQIADDCGKATWTIFPWGGLSGITIRFQVVAPQTCEVSNLVVHQFP